MPRSFKRPDDEIPTGPEWQEFRRERIRYMDGLFRREETAAPAWVVEGLVPRGYLVLLAGKPKDGKTCLCMALAHAVSQGLPFAGMPTVQGTVLYFMCEESPDEFELAIRPHLPEGPIPNLGVAFARLAIDNPFDLQALWLRLNAVKPSLIVVDPLLAASVQGDFGSSGRARNALAGLKRLCREANVAAIVVHHAKERRDRAHRVAENPQLAATASLNVVLNHRHHPKGRLVTLDLSGRGDFANRTLKLVSAGPCDYAPLPRPRGGAGGGETKSPSTAEGPKAQPKVGKNDRSRRLTKGEG